MCYYFNLKFCFKCTGQFVLLVLPKDSKHYNTIFFVVAATISFFLNIDEATLCNSKGPSVAWDIRKVKHPNFTKNEQIVDAHINLFVTKLIRRLGIECGPQCDWLKNSFFFIFGATERLLLSSWMEPIEDSHLYRGQELIWLTILQWKLMTAHSTIKSFRTVVLQFLMVFQNMNPNDMASILMFAH